MFSLNTWLISVIRINQILFYPALFKIFRMNGVFDVSHNRVGLWPSSSLHNHWHAIDPSRQILLRSIEQAQLGIERMMEIEQKKIAGLMQSTTIAKEFLHVLVWQGSCPKNYPRGSFWLVARKINSMRFELR